MSTYADGLHMIFHSQLITNRSCRKCSTHFCMGLQGHRKCSCAALVENTSIRKQTNLSRKPKTFAGFICKYYLVPERFCWQWEDRSSGSTTESRWVRCITPDNPWYTWLRKPFTFVVPRSLMASQWRRYGNITRCGVWFILTLPTTSL